ncbi:MAG: methytransferase partner Trm112 [Methanomicrobiaceae archaeon]|nr:methytransferase partner Trm112 [Methanomicrobiaceae archaeon]
MMRSTMAILCCPVCKGDFDLRVDEIKERGDGEEEILEGVLYCAACDVEYPIHEGIPVLLPRTDEEC